MPEFIINGVPVNFPFEPYALQRVYMEKVIECLENGTNGLLESPTGTGKTLSLLCSALGWLVVKKAQVQLNQARLGMEPQSFEDMMDKVKFQVYNRKTKSKQEAGDALNQFQDSRSWGAPKIIYASRTHSQLNQAMQELKRTKYAFLKASVMGSRDQMCINPDVLKEEGNANKIHMCHHKIASKGCSFFLSLEQKRDHALLQKNEVLDIEDLVQIGRKIKACPYYLSKNMHQEADIIFMPYNYLLDPKAWKANKIDLQNTIVILDEAHNVEKVCEEVASIQIKNSDLAVAIEEVTKVMKFMVDSEDLDTPNEDQPKDFTAGDLADLKQFLLALEKAFQAIEIVNENEGTTYPGAYIFEFLAQANINKNNFGQITSLADSLIQFITTVTNSNLAHKGEGLQKIVDLLQITFATSDPLHEEHVKRCFKVHVAIEQEKNKGYNNKQSNWLSAKTKEKTAVKVMSYWCFSPSFGMKLLLDKQVRSIILTSGTLAPMKPLISELGIPIKVTLENPHIVTGKQICVHIVPNGPDNQMLNSSYENRNNPKYIQSLGCTILSFCSIVPNGLLVFFPSYPVMNKCQESWQCSGLWQQMCRIKPIFVEPRGKDAFNTVMTEFYEKINDPNIRGAVFMAVCRGKVSEGLDFADINGRAVVITGLPFPPLKDDKVVLKKKYLQENRTATNGFLTGDEWYRLEAIRAVNQAIGRVIRHKDDYGAILLCDTRFQNPSLKNQLSKWLQGHVKCDERYGRVVGELCRFFRNAERTLPQPGLKPLSIEDEVINVEEYCSTSSAMNPNELPKPTFTKTFSNAEIKPTNKWNPRNIENANEAVSWSSMSEYKYEPRPSMSSNESADLLDRLEKPTEIIDFNDISSSSLSSVSINNDNPQRPYKKRRLRMVPTDVDIETITNPQPTNKKSETNTTISINSTKIVPENRLEFLILLKDSLPVPCYGKFLAAINAYQHNKNYNILVKVLDEVFLQRKDIHYLFKGLIRFLKDPHKKFFEAHCKEKNIGYC